MDKWHHTGGNYVFLILEWAVLLMFSCFISHTRSPRCCWNFPTTVQFPFANSPGNSFFLLSYPTAGAWSVIANIKHTLSGHGNFSCLSSWCCGFYSGSLFKAHFEWGLAAWNVIKAPSQSLTWETISCYISGSVHRIHFTSLKQRRVQHSIIQYSIISSLGECCALSRSFVLSVLFLIHTLPDWFHWDMVSFSSSRRLQREGLVYCNDTAVVDLS